MGTDLFSDPLFHPSQAAQRVPQTTISRTNNGPTISSKLGRSYELFCNAVLLISRDI